MLLYQNVDDSYLFEQEWTRDRFVTRSLRDLGMVVQLGHPLGDTCNHPKEGHTNFMVIHTNGLHRITIHYCRCAASSPQRQQLLEFGWWPSTVDSPQTCASMQMLRQFHYLSLQSSINLTDYYTALEQMSEPWALATIPVSFSRSSLLSATLKFSFAGSRRGSPFDRPPVSQHEIFVARWSVPQGRRCSRHIEGRAFPCLSCLSACWNQHPR